MKITLDPGSLTFGDLDDFEVKTGEDLMETFRRVDDVGNLSGLKVSSLLALIWVCARQENPEFTYDDARKVRLNELEVEVCGGEDPTPGGD